VKAFVTGSTGLLGNNLAQELLAQGHTVVALVRSPRKAELVLPSHDNLKIVTGDMEDISSFAEHLAQVDALFHTAAYFREYYGAGEHWEKLERINVRGTLQLLEESERRGVGKVIHTSSSGVLGDVPGGAPVDETTPPGPRQAQNQYLKSKLLAEQGIQEFVRRSALPVALILPAAMIGPGDAGPTPEGQLVLNFVKRRIPAILEGGLNFVDARDVARAMIAAVEKGRSGERYLVSHTYLSLADLFEKLEEVTGVPKPRRRLSARSAMALATVMEFVARLRGTASLIDRESVRTLQNRSTHNSAKAQRELGVTYRPIEDTLYDTVAWYAGNGFLEAHQLQGEWPSTAGEE
jgi:dihydroflavonol-4-reductase